MLHRHEAVSDLVVGNRKNRVLGLVEDHIGVLFGFVRRRHDLVGGEDQTAKRGFLFDDLRVVLDVGRSRHAVHKRRDVGRSTDFIEIAGASELLLERDEINRVAAFDQFDHLVEDAPMRIAEEIGGVDDFRGEIEGVVVEEDRAKDGALRFEIVRQRAFSYSVGHRKVLRARCQGLEM